MVHLSDLDWNRPGEQVIEEYTKGDTVKAVVLDVDVDKERISLGIKQLGGDPLRRHRRRVPQGRRRDLRIAEVKEGGLEVKIADTDMTAFIRRSDLARDRDEQRPERFSVGQKVDARITSSTRRPVASSSPSRRWKSLKRRKPSLSTVLPMLAHRSVTSLARP